MSAKDDLDRFDREWESHVEWRTGKRSGVYADSGAPLPDAGAGKYVGGRDGHGTRVDLREMPNDLRAAVLTDLEATVGALVDSKKAAIRASLIARAKEEARRTLEELES